MHTIGGKKRHHEFALEDNPFEIAAKKLKRPMTICQQPPDSGDPMCIQPNESQLKSVKTAFADVRLPFSMGWMREVMIYTTTLRRMTEVYYYTPEGSKMCSLDHIKKYLDNSSDNCLNINHFTFNKTVIYSAPHEIVREHTYRPRSGKKSKRHADVAKFHKNSPMICGVEHPGVPDSSTNRAENCADEEFELNLVNLLGSPLLWSNIKQLQTQIRLLILQSKERNEMKNAKCYSTDITYDGRKIDLESGGATSVTVNDL